MLFSRLNLATLSLLLITGQVSADPLPPGAKTPQASILAGAYLGRTELWESDCGGGIYFGPRGQARAWCATNPSGFAAGNWSVDAYGRMCHDLRWYYKSGGRVGSSSGEKTCITHVSDRRGRIWRNWPESNDWWLLKEGDGVRRGYLFQDKILAAKRWMGI
jgi:hypothetical protein